MSEPGNVAERRDGGPRFGLYLPQLRMDLATIEARVRVAEEQGFDSVWFMDHLAAPGLPDADCYEAWTLATYVAARTESIRIGHLVLNAVLRHPALLAKMAATLDVASGGRFELGLGWGSVPAELRTWGIGIEPRWERAERLGETLEILRRLFTGDPVTYEGRCHALDGAVAKPRPVQDPLPIHVGGAGRRFTLPLVREHADWWNCPAYAVDRLEELRPLAGRARVSVQRPVALASKAADVDAVRSVAERRFGSWGGLVVGTPDDVARRLVDDARRGVELFILQFSDFGTSETLELFAREVAPALREVTDSAESRTPS